MYIFPSLEVVQLYVYHIVVYVLLQYTRVVHNESLLSCHLQSVKTVNRVFF